MIDQETREVLQATLQILKSQMTYVRNLHEALTLQTQSLKEVFPEFEQTERKAFETLVVGNPWQQSQLQQLDELLAKVS